MHKYSDVWRKYSLFGANAMHSTGFEEQSATFEESATYLEQSATYLEQSATYLKQSATSEQSATWYGAE